MNFIDIQAGFGEFITGHRDLRQTAVSTAWHSNSADFQDFQVTTM